METFTISSKAKSHGSWSTEDTDGYPKIMWHPKTSGQISEALAKFSCTTLKIIGLMSPDITFGLGRRPHFPEDDFTPVSKRQSANSMGIYGYLVDLRISSA